MKACHWKAHNTFTNFYLKDLNWSDNDSNMYLGPVVAVQQLLDPSRQTSHPRKEKKRGGGAQTSHPQKENGGVGAHPLQPSLQDTKSQSLGILRLQLESSGSMRYFTTDIGQY